MLGGGWLAAAGLVLLVAVLWRDALLLLIALTVLGAASVSQLWRRYCLERVEVDSRLSERRVDFGEEVDLTLELVNRKLLPLAWLELQAEIPRALAPLRGTVLHSYKPGRANLTAMLSLRWYERVRRHYRFVCHTRGEHLFGPVTLRSGDVFGFTTQELTVPLEQRLLVYPRVVPIGRLDLPMHDPLGDRAARDWLFEDPLRTVGVREYTRGDSRRRIHWGATARTGALQVKLYEPTTDPRLALFLNVQTLGDGWWRGYDPELMELSVTATASIATWASAEGRQVGLYSNGTLPRTVGSIALAPGRAPDQLVQVLELLARVLPLVALPFEALLRRERRTLPYGATVVVVSASVPESVALELRSLRSAGHRVLLLLIGDRATTPELPGIPVRRIPTLGTL